MDDADWKRPQTSGRLGPPRRHPPTAVGVLTPPPPPRPSRGAVYRSSLRVRLAQGFVGVLAVAVGSGVSAVGTGLAATVVGAAIALAGAPLLFASVRARRRLSLRRGAPRAIDGRRAA